MWVCVVFYIFFTDRLAINILKLKIYKKCAILRPRWDNGSGVDRRAPERKKQSFRGWKLGAAAPARFAARHYNDKGTSNLNRRKSQWCANQKRLIAYQRCIE